jgi:hypothetical protein
VFGGFLLVGYFGLVCLQIPQFIRTTGNADVANVFELVWD